MQRKVHNFKSEILVDKTISEYGYHPDKYGPKSAKFVIARCRYCGKEHKIRKGFFTKAGSACHRECKLEEQRQQVSPFKDKKVREKSRKTNLERYGVDHASQNKDISHKISESKRVRSYQHKIKMLTNNSINLCKDYDIHSSLKSLSRQKDDIVNSVKEFYFSEILLNVKNIISPYELDIYIPDMKFAIEFNGSYWHSEAVLESKDAKKKHRRKLDLCREKGIRLFHIFEHHWETRKDQILNFMKSILNKNAIKVSGRKCIITSDNCKDFIDNNHIQGYGYGTTKYFNLVYGDKIVASMTASKHHRQNVQGNPVVLNRLCFASGYNVQGGSSKLFKRFVEWAREEGYDRVLSWSDNTWTEGKIYGILGFDLEREYDPDYFYWDMKNRKYSSKQSQKKSNSGCPKDITEREWSAGKGLFRIWDCGKKLFIYNL